jgi:Mlc titration factor MtfA (ptsG expression regulator)
MIKQNRLKKILTCQINRKMLTIRLVVPFVLIIIITGIFVENINIKAIIIGLCIVPIILANIFKPQIDWWYYQRHPQMLHPKMRNFVLQFMPYYVGLSDEFKIRFEQRMSLIMLSKSYEKRGMDSIPEDLKGWIAANIAKLTFGLEKYLFPKYEVVVLSDKKFLSPEIPTFHASEVFEDGAFGGVIFAADYLINALQQQSQYNIIIHEYTNALWKINKWSEKDFLAYATPENLLILAKIRGLSLAQIQNILGTPKINFFAVAVEHFFANPKELNDYIPALYKEISLKLNQDPLLSSSPLKFDIVIE